MQSDKEMTLFQALAAAQAEMANPPLDGYNPHFKNKFSTLKAVRDAVVPALAKHGIAAFQTYEIVGERQCLVTNLVLGKDVIRSVVPLPEYSNPQQWSSASTYIRRVSLLAIACTVGDPDEDAEEASKPETENPFHGSVERAAFTKAVNLYQQRVLEAIDKAPSQVPSILQEAKDSSEEIASALWRAFSTPVQNRIRDILPKPNVGAAGVGANNVAPLSDGRSPKPKW